MRAKNDDAWSDPCDVATWCRRVGVVVGAIAVPIADYQDSAKLLGLFLFLLPISLIGGFLVGHAIGAVFHLMIMAITFGHFGGDQCQCPRCESQRRYDAKARELERRSKKQELRNSRLN